jgi:hypothetical protein
MRNHAHLVNIGHGRTYLFDLRQIQVVKSNDPSDNSIRSFARRLPNGSG